jgi:nucleoid-associated protein YejK
MRMPKKEEVFVITEWGCLGSTLKEYGIDVSHITGRVGKHIVDDFMDAMCKAGYVEKKENDHE